MENKTSTSNPNATSLPQYSSTRNIILNHDFSRGLHSWHPNNCHAFIESQSPKLTGPFAVVTNRNETWQGLEQDITDKVSVGIEYSVCAWVAISGRNADNVQATVKVEYQDSSPTYLFIGRNSASMERWEKVEGTFQLSSVPRRVTFYLEGPSPGLDLLVKTVEISSTTATLCDIHSSSSSFDGDESIIRNPKFDDGINNWSGRGCKIVLRDSMSHGNVLPKSGKFFVSTTDRTQNWNGIQQDITLRVQRKRAYEVDATIRIFGNNITSADVRATIYVKTADHREEYIGIGSVQATVNDWVQLRGKFLINGYPSSVILFLEGPNPGTDILLDNLFVNHSAKSLRASTRSIKNAYFGVNVITNSNLSDNTMGWFPLGNCTLSVRNGSPHMLPPMARESLETHESLSGRYILVTNRTQTWMGPAQIITDKLNLYLTYQVSAWVRIANGSTKPQSISVTLSVDDQWVNGGQVESKDDEWHEICGSFRIEKQPEKVMAYVQGPDAGVDLMVGGLQIFPVDRHKRFEHLKNQIEKVRKRDVILKFSATDSSALATDSSALNGTFVNVKQTQNSFPFGSCVSRSNIDNEDFVDFFTKNFNWAVFGNELKWYWTEPQQGNLKYKDADEMVNFLTARNIQLRGHCIFWEVESAIPSWICSLSKSDMMSAVQNRLTGLLTRYKGKFKHYDVNNEMLHGSFFQDNLGKDIWASMFKIANQLDPSATLFVNDYNIEDCCDTQSSPEKYIEHILDLQEQGAPVGGIGLQGHIDCPIGPIVCSSLNKLGILGLPIWFTELDVSSASEFVRADDLEVMLREAFAHPAVEGVMLWGFWELFMSRDNSHLVNAEGVLNEAGKRYLELKKEWLSHGSGKIDELGEFKFRGFHGTYEVEVVTVSKKKVLKTFVVDPGSEPVVISIRL